MKKKGQIPGNPIMMLILLAMMIFIGIGLLQPITSTKAIMTSKSTMVNQTLSLLPAVINNTDVNDSINLTIYANSAWKQATSECALTNVVFTAVNGTALVQNADYILYTTPGTMTLLNTSINSPITSLNRTYANFTFCQDGYLTNTGDRSLTSLIPTMAIIALLITAALVAYKQMNQ